MKRVMAIDVHLEVAELTHGSSLQRKKKKWRRWAVQTREYKI
jgi:hypothetical protein